MIRTIVCPSCSYSREVPADRIPPGEVSVNCPRCGAAFLLKGEEKEQSEETSFRNDAAASAPEEVVGESSTAANRDTALLGISELFEQSFGLFKNRAGTLLLLVLLCMVAVLLPVLFLMGMGFVMGMLLPDLQVPLMVGGGVTGGVVALVAAVWGGGAFLCAVADDSLDLRGAIVKGWDYFLPFLGLFVLAGFLQTGATFFFIVPGIILWVCFAFAPFIVAEGRARGFESLMLSMAYTTTDWFSVFVRLLLVWLIGMALGVVPFVGGMLSLAYVPFEYIIIWRLYRNLVDLQGDTPKAVGGGMRAAVVIVSVLGWLVVPAIIFLVIGIAALQQLIV